MSDEADPRPDEEAPALAMPEPLEEMAPEVAFVVPAAAYESIATHEAAAAPGRAARLRPT